MSETASRTQQPPAPECYSLASAVIDMLNILDYEANFCDKDTPPVHPIYFCGPAGNAALQFAYFTRLVAWLLSLLKKRAAWDEYDDPHTVCTNILVALKDAGLPADFPPQRLKTGYGDTVLHGLCGKVIEKTGFRFLEPDFSVLDQGQPRTDFENDMGDELEEEVEDSVSDGDDDAEYFGAAPPGPSRGESFAVGLLEEKQIVRSTVKPEDWRVECERVSHRLRKIGPGLVDREWRSHLMQTQQYHDLFNSQFPTVKAQLTKLSAELDKSLREIVEKEEIIGRLFDNKAESYRQMAAAHEDKTKEYNELNDSILNLQMELKTITDSLEQTRHEMEQRSSTVTDTQPLVKLKDTIKRMKAEMRQMDLRIGIVSHTLLQTHLRSPADQENSGILGINTWENEDED
ncbi:Intraflagellar transport protein 57 [Perkinsus olseni]|uniref:Intraflagellar transport protein 57 n=1 Tax=Perkinsus olseni TaxID=32597 RepID=A0A7J6MX05_PEROL|nr:Intraflagellar transport protein 57 [Perkinsus olseni]KAF4675431.1 Intraflagellar transport protein 57 [Perkinsus olseni]